jgi:hypothetical protein
MFRQKLEHNVRIVEIWKQETGRPVNMTTIELIDKIYRNQKRWTNKYRHQNLVDL